MAITTGLIIIILGIGLYALGPQFLSPYICKQCDGWNKINPVCHIQSKGCNLVFITFLSIGFLLVGLIIMLRR